MTFSCDFSVLRISGMMLEGLNSEHVILYMHVLLVGHGQPAGTRYPCGHGYGQKPVPGCGYGFLSEQVSFSRARVWERDTQRVHARCHLYLAMLSARTRTIRGTGQMAYNLGVGTTSPLHAFERSALEPDGLRWRGGSSSPRRT